MKGKYLQMFGSPFVMYVCSIKHNIIINHFIRRPLNVKKLKINFFLTHFYILITIYSCHFRLFFLCSLYLEPPAQWFIISHSNSIFYYVSAYDDVGKSSFNGNWEEKKSFETVQISFFRIAWCDCLMCKRQASSPSGISPPLNLLTRVSN